MALSCTDIESLVDPYLDGELDDRDLHDFVDHTSECAGCGERLERQETDRKFLRVKLAAPPAPSSFHAQIRTSLDQADIQAQLATRRARLGWVLPGVAVFAAAAAMVLFVVVKEPRQIHRSVASAAVKQHSRQLPVEVEGTQVPAFVKKHYSKQARLPQFRTNSDLVGARATSLMGEDAMQLYFKVERDRRRHDVQVHMFRANRFKVRSKHRQIIRGHQVWIDDIAGVSTITVKLANGQGYVFTSPSLQPKSLLDLLYKSNLGFAAQPAQ